MKKVLGAAQAMKGMAAQYPEKKAQSHACQVIERNCLLDSALTHPAIKERGRNGWL